MYNSFPVFARWALPASQPAPARENELESKNASTVNDPPATPEAALIALAKVGTNG
jgi:hypothetical protein